MMKRPCQPSGARLPVSTCATRSSTPAGLVLDCAKVTLSRIRVALDVSRCVELHSRASLFARRPLGARASCPLEHHGPSAGRPSRASGPGGQDARAPGNGTTRLADPRRSLAGRCLRQVARESRNRISAPVRDRRLANRCRNRFALGRRSRRASARLVQARPTPERGGPAPDHADHETGAEFHARTDPGSPTSSPAPCNTLPRPGAAARRASP